MRETGCLNNFLGYFSMTPALHLASQTCEGLHQVRALPQLLLVAYFSLSSRHPVFLFTPFPTQSVRLPLVTYPSLCNTCVTYGTLCRAICHQVLLTKPLPRDAEDFPRNDRYFSHVSLLTYLIYFSPKVVYMLGPIYVLRSSRGTLINPSLVLNQRF